MTDKQEHKCVGRVSSGWHSRQCGKTGAYEYMGQHFCKAHHPPTVEAKRAAQHSAWEAKFAMDRSMRLQVEQDAAEQKRRAALYPELLKACQQALYALKGREHDGFLREVIAKATGSDS